MQTFGYQFHDQQYERGRAKEEENNPEWKDKPNYDPNRGEGKSGMSQSEHDRKSPRFDQPVSEHLTGTQVQDDRKISKADLHGSGASSSETKPIIDF